MTTSTPLHTIVLNQTVDREGTAYIVLAEGQAIGSYYQKRGSAVVTSDHLPDYAQNELGAIEAIQYFIDRSELKTGIVSIDPVPGRVILEPKLKRQVLDRAKSNGGLRGMSLDVFKSLADSVGVDEVVLYIGVQDLLGAEVPA